MGLFGPSKGEIWQKLSGELGGEYLKSWRGDKLQVSHGEWTLTLDTFVVMAGTTPVVFTRMRAPYVAGSDFRFSITRRNIFRDLAVWLGAQDIDTKVFNETMSVIVKHRTDIELVSERVGIKLGGGLGGAVGAPTGA